jgi:hypothetical protein
MNTLWIKDFFKVREEAPGKNRGNKIITTELKKACIYWQSSVSFWLWLFVYLTAGIGIYHLSKFQLWLTIKIDINNWIIKPIFGIFVLGFILHIIFIVINLDKIKNRGQDVFVILTSLIKITKYIILVLQLIIWLLFLFYWIKDYLF